MAIFQCVAELGSFRKAARLNLLPSVISHHVSKLEDHLGTPLQYRSTRRMSLTGAGQSFLRRRRACQPAKRTVFPPCNRDARSFVSGFQFAGLSRKIPAYSSPLPFAGTTPRGS